MNPKKIFEIGVAQLELCRTLNFWSKDSKDTQCILFEPIPKFFNQIKDCIIANKIINVEVFNYAIYKEEKEMFFWEAGECSFLVEEKNGVHGQAGNLEEFETNKNKIIVQCEKITKFDTGDIDLLLVDTEGSEWYSLEELISRPKLIVLETHMKIGNTDAMYINPFINEINDWMNKNNYSLIKKTNSDSYYINNLFLSDKDEILSWVE